MPDDLTSFITTKDSGERGSTTAARLFVVLVLYKRAPEQSEAFVSLRDVLEALPTMRAQVTSLLYDNSPEPHAVPVVNFACSYIWNGANPGLAHAYNAALERAVAEGSNWLLLLDHDTALDRTYLEEVLATIESFEADRTITALVPKLLQASSILSPHRLVPRLRKQSEPIVKSFAGIAGERLQVFNSGAVLRVADLVAIGGFDESFPFEYLDHVVFRQLQDRGGKLLVLNATLAHELSVSAGWSDSAFQHRFWSFMAAEHRYKQRFAKGNELFWHYFWKSWLIFGRLARGQFRVAYKHLRIALR